MWVSAIFLWRANNRHKGLRAVHLVAEAIDPRTKHMIQGYGPLDQYKIWKEVRDRAILVAHELELELPVVQVQTEATATHMHIYDPLLDRLDEEADEPFIPTPVEQIVDAEISVYKLLRRLSRIDNDGHFTNPLLWWKQHEKSLPILATLARYTLCIPATSAPSERFLFALHGLSTKNT